jgi:transcription initiation factor TFIIB
MVSETAKYGSKFSADAYDFHVLKNGLGLSETIIDNAKYVIRNASREGLVRGRTHTTIVAAAVYIACRETEARPLHDIASIANVKQKILARYCRILMNKLYVKLPAIDPFKCILLFRQGRLRLLKNLKN